MPEYIPFDMAIPAKRKSGRKLSVNLLVADVLSL
jgi:hypothetical protein